MSCVRAVISYKRPGDEDVSQNTKPRPSYSESMPGL